MVFLITACSKSEIAGSSPEGGEKAGQEEKRPLRPNNLDKKSR